MIRKNVYVTFDERDRSSYEKVAAWNKNPYLGFSFIGSTAAEQGRGSAVKTKNDILSGLAHSCAVLVLVGEGSNDTSPDCLEIGAINWQSFAIARSIERGCPLVCVKLDDACAAPVAVRNAEVAWAAAFTLESVMGTLAKLS